MHGTKYFKKFSKNTKGGLMMNDDTEGLLHSFSRLLTTGNTKKKNDTITMECVIAILKSKMTKVGKIYEVT